MSSQFFPRELPSGGWGGGNRCHLTPGEKEVSLSDDEVMQHHCWVDAGD